MDVNIVVAKILLLQDDQVGLLVSVFFSNVSELPFHALAASNGDANSSILVLLDDTIRVIFPLSISIALSCYPDTLLVVIDANL